VPIEPRQPTAKGPVESFTGDVYIDPAVRATEPSRVNVNAVRFTPGARTAWHTHTVSQTLVVTDGLGRHQPRGGAVEEIAPATSWSRPPTSGTGTAQPRTTT
jgi:quercetin dioxygenase-like cupin family protein